MKFYVLMLCLLSLALPAAAADSAADRGLAEVGVLGRLNGQALACSRTENVARIKLLMIQLAPKTRRYGEAFEKATNDAYLAQARKDKATCMEASALSEQVEEAARHLQTALNVNAIEKTAP